MKDRIYLDNSLTTRPSKAVVFAMQAFYDELYGAHSAPHMMGQELMPHVEKSYRHIYKLFSAQENDHFVFTSSGVEAISQVMHSVYRGVVKETGKNQIIISAIGDAADHFAISHLEDEGVLLKTCATQSGLITKDTLIESLSPRTALLSLSYTTPLTGLVHDLTEIYALCKQRDILLHLDVSQSVGKLVIDLHELQADYLTFSGEHMFAPLGTGGLFVKNSEKSPPLFPLIAGEGERLRHRGGPLNVPLLVALGQAAFEAEEDTMLYCTEVLRLRNLFEEGLKNNFPETHILFEDAHRLPHTSVCAFPGIKNEALLFAINRKGVFANIGGGAFQTLENIVQASGYPFDIASSTIHFSLSKYTTEQEIERAVSIITDACKKLRRLTKAYYPVPT